VNAPTKVMIAGLDPRTASELSGALDQLSVEVSAAEADLGFCSLEALPEFRNRHPGLPVVVVGVVPQVSEWLDAIESGAQDYCSAPFEPSLLGWILKSVTRPSVQRAA
jgi:DNA-binding NtrC family response regulator